MEKTLSKKLIVAVGAVLMAVAMLIPAVAFASTLTITNTSVGKTYDAYVFFERDGANYVIDDSSSFKEAFDSYVASNPGMFNVGEGPRHVITPTDNFDEIAAANLAQVAMTYYDSWKASSHVSKVATTSKVEFTGIDDGYYIVHSSGGNVLSMVAVDGTGTINEKNAHWNTKFNIIRDAVGYYEQTDVKTEVSFDVAYDGADGSKQLCVKNNYVEGAIQNLTLNESSIAVTYNWVNAETESNATVDPSWYTLSTTATGYTLTLNENAHFDAGTALIIKNTASANEGLSIYDSGSVANVHTCYAESYDLKMSSTQPVSTAEDSFRCLGMGLTKIDGDGCTILSGAQFSVYTQATGGTPISFLKSGNVYTVSTSTVTGTTTTIDAGAIIINGLGTNTYYFEETQAPEGYNPLTERVNLKLTNDSDYASYETIEGSEQYIDGGLAVVNHIGIVLPSTGGIGTLIFTLIGAGILIGAIAYRMSRKRVNNCGVDVTS